jgi:hypothetical protein
VELALLGTDRLDLSSIDLSILSVEALNDILAGASFSIDSEDRLLEQLLSLGDEYLPLLGWIEIPFLSATGVAALTEDLEFPLEWVWWGIPDRLIHPPPPPTPPPAPPPRGPFGSVIVMDFPGILAEFKAKQVALLWRGSRDGFGARDFHSRCDGHANTLTVIVDTKGSIFGGFTPVEWDFTGNYKADPSLKSFLFTLTNPRNIPARRLALKTEMKNGAIYCDSRQGPCFGDGDIDVGDNCNANTDSQTFLGYCYTNDTKLDAKTFFTGSERFQVKEIEVFEISA